MDGRGWCVSGESSSSSVRSGGGCTVSIGVGGVGVEDATVLRRRVGRARRQRRIPIPTAVGIIGIVGVRRVLEAHARVERGERRVEVRYQAMTVPVMVRGMLRGMVPLMRLMMLMLIIVERRGGSGIIVERGGLAAGHGDRGGDVEDVVRALCLGVVVVRPAVLLLLVVLRLLMVGLLVVRVGLVVVVVLVGGSHKAHKVVLKVARMLWCRKFPVAPSNTDIGGEPRAVVSAPTIGGIARIPIPIARIAVVGVGVGVGVTPAGGSGSGSEDVYVVVDGVRGGGRRGQVEALDAHLRLVRRGRRVRMRVVVRHYLPLDRRCLRGGGVVVGDEEGEEGDGVES